MHVLVEKSIYRDPSINVSLSLSHLFVYCMIERWRQHLCVFVSEGVSVSSCVEKKNSVATRTRGNMLHKYLFFDSLRPLVHASPLHSRDNGSTRPIGSINSNVVGALSAFSSSPVHAPGYLLQVSSSDVLHACLLCSMTNRGLASLATLFFQRIFIFLKEIIHFLLGNNGVGKCQNSPKSGLFHCKLLICKCVF